MESDSGSDLDSGSDSSNLSIEDIPEVRGEDGVVFAVPALPPPHQNLRPSRRAAAHVERGRDEAVNAGDGAIFDEEVTEVSHESLSVVSAFF